MGCNQAEQPTQAPETHTDMPQAKPVGNLMKEFRVTDETTVRFQEAAGIITLSLDAHLDEKDINKALEDKLFQAPNMEAAYRIMDPVGTVPQAILDFDKHPAKTEEGAAPGTPEAAGPGLALPAPRRSPWRRLAIMPTRRLMPIGIGPPMRNGGKAS